MSRRILRGGVLPDRPELGTVDILVDDGRIAGLGPAGSIALSDGDSLLPLDGMWVLPGFIDAHVHPIHSESMSSVGREGVLGGVTTVLNHLYPTPDETLAEAVRRNAADSRDAASDFGYHLRITPDRIDMAGAPGHRSALLSAQIIEALTVGGVVAVKAFLSHADDRVRSTLAGLTEILLAGAETGIPVIVHAEPGEVITVLDGRYGTPESLGEHDRRRSADLEAAAVALAAATARAVDARLYVAHLSSDRAVDAVARARAWGTRVRGESCTHYFDLDSGRTLGALGRVTPPLRGPDSMARMRELAADSDSGIDVIASDHCGYSAEEKEHTDFALAGNGLPGIDSMAPILIDAVIAGGWLMAADLVRLTSRGPAEAFGLIGKGRILEGFDADLVVVDPRGRGELREHPPGPATAASPYGGRRLAGSIRRVIRRGSDAVVDGVDHELRDARPVERTEPEW
ncbi:dihydroorotase family protein [Microbacterium sp. 18062]|uniref:dihydroorotase n=1 Tax=Microbacterium sp. 18062 TaxID=2681410 RepID=UPI00135B28C2|nr:dihydroorotase family protein [Microbacterium sp. 18062]